MYRRGLAKALGLVALTVLLAACTGYTETGSSTSSHQGMAGGDETVQISKANGTSEKSIELEADDGLLMEVDVTLAVGKGSYKIELLDDNGEATMTLEAHDGQTVTGHGQMVTDAFGEASYRVTAVEAENVAYVLEYTFQ